MRSYARAIIGRPAVATLVMLLLTTAGCDRLGGEATPTATPDATAAADAAAPPTADREVRQVVTADGALVLPVPPQPLSFPAGGRVLEVTVSAGDEVEDGQMLARLDPLPLQRAVAEAEAALATARERLESAEEPPARSAVSSAEAELATAQSALQQLESGTSLEQARLEVERAKNTLWGQQAQRDATCGQTERGFATQAACDTAQASVQAAEQAVQIAQQGLASARETRDADLAAARARVAAAEASLAKTRTGSTETQLQAARAGVAQAEAGLEQARRNLERASLQAPFAGTVTAVHVAEQVEVAPGAPVVTLAKTEPLRFATTNLSERYVGDIAPGAPAEITLTAHPDRPLEAEVARIAGQSETSASGTIVFTVYLDITDDRGLPLRAGMTGRVEITVGEASAS